MKYCCWCCCCYLVVVVVVIVVIVLFFYYPLFSFLLLLLLLFGQNWVSNSWDDKDIEFVWVVGLVVVGSGVHSHFRVKPNWGDVRLGLTWLVVEFGLWHKNQLFSFSKLYEVTKSEISPYLMLVSLCNFKLKLIR